MSPRELTPEDRARLRADVTAASRVVAPLWPIGTFIAVNPLAGFEDRPFEQAVADAGELLGARGYPAVADLQAAYADGRITDEDLERNGSSAAALLEAAEPAVARRVVTAGARADAQLGTAIAETVDDESAKWLGAFVDERQATWRMPGRERGYYAAWRALVGSDPAVRRLGIRAALADLPERADDALGAALETLGVPAGPERVEVLRGHLAQLPGWASHIRWRAEEADPGSGARQAPLDLVDHLAVRLSYEAALVRAVVDPAALAAGAPATPRRGERPADPRAAWLAAYEGHYRDGLLAALDRPAPEPRPARPAAQAVFCIDARSEGLRRHLEARGDYETLGFAGFFAVAIRFRSLGAQGGAALCPVLLAPAVEVTERPLAEAEGTAERALAGRRALAGAEAAFHAAKGGLASPFALAEAAGWAAGPLAAAKTFASRRQDAVRGRAARQAAPEVETAPTVDAVGDGLGFALEEQVLFAEAALTMMGLTRGFAPLVLLCAHGSRTENNPYASALDCGACGGNHGGPNARVAAAILNRSLVREALAGRGLAIPPGTWFVAGEHDTTADTVAILDAHAVPESHLEALAQLRDDLAHAGRDLAQERLASLPGAHGAADLHASGRGRDWAQVRPEWGLARNAAFVVGPRSVTRGLDLGCRTFLHSYDHHVDPEGTALETILTAPLVVAQWINAQYYFSTVDPAAFGSGDKTIHNVTGGIGVLQGHNGDLQVGLPWQSVMDAGSLYHEPMRLLAVVQAPLATIDRLVARNGVLQRLFGNGWVHLAAREAPGEAWQLRERTGGWVPWRPAVAAAAGARA